MRTMRTYYEILGLPRDATLAQIKRRYRQLARKYHPDVAKDKQMATRLFIQINEAYDALSDSTRRRAYDADLENAAAKTTYRAAHATRERGDARTESVSKLLSDAQFAYINKRFTDAVAACRRAISLDPTNGSAYAMLGDVYRAMGKRGQAVKCYSYAMQYNPADRESNKKLMDLLGKQAAARANSHAGQRQSKGMLAVNIALFSVAGFLLFLINISPGQPIPWLVKYFPPADRWSVNLAVLIASASVVVGFALAINRLLANPDEELVFEGGSSWAVVPTGLLLLLGSGLFFLGSAAFYIIVGFAQGTLSRSVMTVFACVTAVALIAALMYSEPAVKQVLLFGGNVSFIPMLIGWYLGAAFQPMNE